MKQLAAVVCISGLAVTAFAAEPDVVREDIRLSPDVLKLLRAEMGEIATGVQSVALSLATADWKAIQATGRQIQASYIMEKKLTPTQAKELEQALPAHFKRLDTEFHQRAEKLEIAAAAHDSERVAFEYSRMIEGCAVCHTAYAKTRFPEFSSHEARKHSH